MTRGEVVGGFRKGGVDQKREGRREGHTGGGGDDDDDDDQGGVVGMVRKVFGGFGGKRGNDWVERRREVEREELEEKGYAGVIVGEVREVLGRDRETGEKIVGGVEDAVKDGGPGGTRGGREVGR